jgi:D-alanyl-D-alanine carboxypeptidase/D-alanyl-D-alanine-endopeptidase (penicillin-binding protein 4)
MITAPRRLLALVPVLLLLAGPALGSLRGNIDYIVKSGNLGRATTGVSVRDAGTGNVVVDMDGMVDMIPASNLKLFTTGAALHALGPDFRFESRLLRTGDRIIIVGDGDPGFGDPTLRAKMATPAGTPMDVETFLDLWVDAIKATGLTAVSEIVVDDSVFDREYVHPTWPRDQLNRRYCAQVSGFSFHLNQLHFFPRPRPGARPSVALMEPQAELVISNKATSRRGVDDNDTVWIARRLGTNELTFYGNVKHPFRTPVPVTVHDMPMFFGGIIANRLRSAGIQVGSVRVTVPAEVPSEGTPVGPTIHTPISTAITRCNRDSQNLYAESLIKRVGGAMTGQPGSWLNGAAIIRLVVHERLGSAALSSTLRVADGSGLSRDNRVAPATITAWLDSFHKDERLGETFIDSLAVGGQTGTLRKRRALALPDGAVVQAKSGYINGVSCLSGYVTLADGRRRCFSIMINDVAVPLGRVKRVQEKIVKAIYEDMVESEGTTPEPATAIGG